MLKALLLNIRLLLHITPTLRLQLCPTTYLRHFPVLAVEYDIGHGNEKVDRFQEGGGGGQVDDFGGKPELTRGIGKRPAPEHQTHHALES